MSGKFGTLGESDSRQGIDEKLWNFERKFLRENWSFVNYLYD